VVRAVVPSGTQQLWRVHQGQVPMKAVTFRKAPPLFIAGVEAVVESSVIPGRASAEDATLAQEKSAKTGSQAVPRASRRRSPFAV